LPKITANGIEIEYESFGAASAEAMLLISGLGTQMLRWDAPFCEMLAARGYRVIRFDNRDAGLSTQFAHAPIPDLAALTGAMARGEHPQVPYTLHDMADDTLGLMDALGIERAHLVGRSMGGMIAQLLASEYPQRTLSLTAIMSSTGSPALPPPTPAAMAMLMKRPPNPFQDEDGYLAHSAALARAIGSPGYPLDAAAQRKLAQSELKRAYHPAGFGRQIAAIAATGDLRPRLGSITCPTLVVHGAEDPLVPPSCGKDIAQNVRDAALMIVEGMGHEVPAPLYETVADAIVRNARRPRRREA
jgi:pimeloyl-ACP methyl ester carboxylesterase